MMIGNLFSVRHINFVVIGLILSFLCVSPTLAQPTSLRQFRGSKQLIQHRIEEIAKITRQIENDKSNVLLYKRRLQLNGDLLVLNEDTNDWNTYADKYEADLSKIIELEKTAENYYRRGGWFLSRLLYSEPFCPYPPPNKISELYPRNRYVEEATADFLEALRLTSDPQERQSYYTNLSIIYSTRPQKLISAPDFAKWKNDIPLERVKEDFEMSVKYSQLALKAGASLPFVKTLKQNLAATYLSNADVAKKLGDTATVLKFTQAAQKYR